MKEPFSASGKIQSFDIGNVHEAGNSNRFLVEDRRVEGTVEGGIEGTFTIDFDGNLALETQSGPLHGTVYFFDDDGELSYTATLRARSQGEVESFEPGVGGIMELEIDGRLNFFGNAKGFAKIDSTFDVILDEYGHIVDVADSDIGLDGALII